MVYFGRAAVFSKSVLPRPLAAFGSVHRPGRRFVCALGDRIPDPAPDRYAVVIVDGCQLIGASVSFYPLARAEQCLPAYPGTLRTGEIAPASCTGPRRPPHTISQLEGDGFEPASRLEGGRSPS